MLAASSVVAVVDWQVVGCWLPLSSLNTICPSLLSIALAAIQLSVAVASSKLPDHPYAYGALDPIISETTLRTQHLKHHAK